MQPALPQRGQHELANSVRFGAEDFDLGESGSMVHVVVLDLDRLLPSAMQDVQEMTLSGRRLADAMRTHEVPTGLAYKRKLITRLWIFGVLCVVPFALPLASVGAQGFLVLVGLLAYVPATYYLYLVVTEWMAGAFKAVEPGARPSGAVEQTVLLSEAVRRRGDTYQYWRRIDKGWSTVKEVRAWTPKSGLREVIRLGYEAQAELAMLARAGRTGVDEVGLHHERAQMAIEAFEARVGATLSQAEAARRRRQAAAAKGAETRRLRARQKAAEEAARVSQELDELRRRRPILPPEPGPQPQWADSEPLSIAPVPEPVSTTAEN